MSDLTAVFHIGTMKTGSTSIQSFLELNKTSLQSNGIAPLVFGQNPNRTGLNSCGAYVYTFPDKTFGKKGALPDIFSDFSITEHAHLAAFKEAAKANLKTEIDALPDNVTRTIVSSEALSFASETQIAELKALLDTFVSNYKIVFYVRRQDKFLCSKYTTDLAKLETDTIVEYFQNSINLSSMYYDDLADKWAAVFGEECIFPRVFDRKELYGGDAVADLANFLGFPDMNKFSPVEPTNDSILPTAQETIRRINVLIRNSDREHRTKRMLQRTLRREYRGPGDKPSRAVVSAFLRNFEDSNERMRKRWFPHMSELFSRDLGEYPEHYVPPNPLDASESLMLLSEAFLAERKLLIDKHKTTLTKVKSNFREKLKPVKKLPKQKRS